MVKLLMESKIARYHPNSSFSHAIPLVGGEGPKEV